MLVLNLFFALMIIGPTAQAGTNTGFSYQGRIIRPSGEPANSGTISFSLKILDATSNCTLWSETQSLDMTGNQGTFSLVLGAGTRTDGGSHTFKQVFINAGVISSLTCGSGTTSTPGASDDRNLVVTINDGGTIVSLGSMPIKSVPYAMQADQVSGYGIMNLAKISGLGSATSITGIQFDFLANLAAPASASATPCINNDVLKFVGGVWTCAAAGAGTASTSGLTAAIATNTIDNANYAQTWNWTTATTENLFNIAGNALTTGSLLNVTSNNASLNSSNGLLNIANTGASTTGTVARIQSNSAAGSGLTVLANGNVGVGTATPAYNLDLGTNYSRLGINAGTGGITTPLKFYSPGGLSTRFMTSAGGGAYFLDTRVNGQDSGWTDNNTFPEWATRIDAVGDSFSVIRGPAGAGPISYTSLFTVKGNGNVGIGTAASANNLHVYQASAASGITVQSDGNLTSLRLDPNGTYGWTLEAGSSGGNGNLFSVRENFSNQDYLQMQPGLPNSSPVPIYIKNNGNVGIGTSTPAEKLDVSGAIKIGTTASANAGTIRWDGTNFQGYNGAAWTSFIPQAPAATACDTTQVLTTAGTYAYTVPAVFGAITIRIWGGGGGSGGVVGTVNGNPGQTSSIASLSLIAGGGLGGLGGPSAGSGLGGAGGTGSGGTINTAGDAGTAGNGSSAGSGGASANGGGTQAGGTGNGGGTNGNQPGGGAAGSSWSSGSAYAGGGGGGAYVEKIYSSATLIPGTYLSDIIVGAGGGRGVGGSASGGNGATGKITITCASAGAAPVNDRGIVFWDTGAHASNSNFVYTAAGNVGIGTAAPQATLDVNGYVRMAKYAAQPIACDAAHDGSLAVTSQYTLCVCKGGSAAWVKTTDGSTACAW